MAISAAPVGCNASQVFFVALERDHAGYIVQNAVVLHNMDGRYVRAAQSHDIEAGILDPAAPNFEQRYRMLRRRKARFRVLGRSWWCEELPSEEEYATALETLERANWKVDYVITHCAPTRIVMSMSQHNEADRLTDFLEMVRRRLKFHYWLCGHYHRNQDIGENFILLYEQIVQTI